MDAVIARLFCLAGYHASTYVERREIADVSVRHFVCPVCNYAVPVLERTEAEYRQIAFSQVKPLKAVRGKSRLMNVVFSCDARPFMQSIDRALDELDDLQHVVGLESRRGQR